jgi:hypothetical protein
MAVNVKTLFDQYRSTPTPTSRGPETESTYVLLKNITIQKSSNVKGKTIPVTGCEFP